MEEDMKTIYLKKSESKKTKGVNYSTIIDAFDVAAVQKWKRDNDEQISEVQRKKINNHVKEIVKSLRKEKEHYAWTMMVNVKGDIKIKKEKLYNSKGELVCTEYFMEWPETEEEMAKLAPYIEIVDG